MLAQFEPSAFMFTVPTTLTTPPVWDATPLLCKKYSGFALFRTSLTALLIVMPPVAALEILPPPPVAVPPIAIPLKLFAKT